MLGVVALDYNGLGFLMTRYPLEVIASFYHQLAAHVVNCQHIQPDKNRHSLGILKKSYLSVSSFKYFFNWNFAKKI
jgi:hypothetical protein